MSTTAAILVGIQAIWEETLGALSVCIAVLDGPVDLSHPCFDGANLTQVEMPGSELGYLSPSLKHGTHVASIMFGQHGSPVAGIAPGCRGISIPIFRDGPSNSVAPCSQLDLARGITNAVEAGAHVINISGGQFEPSGESHHFLAEAVRLCADQDILIVAATGNEGCECLHVPAALPSVLAVGAMDANGNPLLSSNWASAYRTRGVLAPGENILGALPGGGFDSATGTSVATPIVSGVAALLMSLQGKCGHKPSARAVRSAILSSAAAGTERHRFDWPQLLAGRLNIEGATMQITQGGAVMTDSIDNSNERLLDQQEGGGDGRAGTTDSPAAPGTAAEGNEIRKATLSKPAVVPATCGCGQPGCTGNCRAAAQFVFALGQLGFDYGTEARRDSIAQHMGGDPSNPELLLAYLDKNPWDAAAINWTLSLDAVRIYAIHADGAFATQVYERLRAFLRGQLTEGVERISVPGVLAGQRTLLSGEVVPVICPDLRGMYSWTTAALVQAVAGPPPAKAAKERDTYGIKTQGVRNFLERVYNELRNLGLTAQERAINYAATNAFAIHQIFESALKEQMELDTIEAVRSPICRPDSDCWDVKLTFFDPEKIFQRARRTYRFTVDVSDVVPVTVGPVRSWSVR